MKEWLNLQTSSRLNTLRLLHTHLLLLRLLRLLHNLLRLLLFQTRTLLLLLQL
jgi:hypothetical protein